MGDPTTDNYVLHGGSFDVAPTLRAGGNYTRGDRPYGTDVDTCDSLQIVHSLRADGFDASEDGTGRGTPLVPMSFMPARTFGKDGGIDSRYAPRDVCDAVHTATGNGNKAPLILQKERVGTSRCLDCLIDIDVYYLPGTEILAPFTCPQCGGHPGFMTYDTQHGGTAPTAQQVPQAVAFSLRGREYRSQPELADQESVRAASGDSSRSYVAFTCSEQSNAYAWEKDYYPALDAQIPNDTSNIQKGMQVRRLTPVECCRLQGFTDDYLDIIYNGKPAADGPRYKALGNSFAVPCMHWIGRRIQLVDLFT